MNAAAKVAPAPGIELVEVAEPRPAAGEMLIRVAFCGICGSDLPVYRWQGQPTKWKEQLPRVMGHEFAGVIEDLGAAAGAPGWRIGDKVAVEPGVTCGTCAACRQGFGNLCERRSIVGIDRNGAFAPLVSVPVTNGFRLDPDADLRHAAFLEVFALGVHAVERARLTPGDRVLVLGAGPVALSAVALAALSGCEQVVVAGAPPDFALRLPLARAVGATATVAAADLEELAPFDVVIEASGAVAAVRAAISRCRTGGRIVAVGTALNLIELDWTELVMRAIRVTPVRARLDRHWERATRLLPRVPFPETFFHVYPLASVTDAFEAALAGSAAKVLIDPRKGSSPVEQPSPGGGAT